MANNEISQHIHGGQGRVGGPQAPLIGHGNDPQTQIEHEGEI